MKNRDRLLQINDLDMLARINRFFDLAQDNAISDPERYENVCVLDAIMERKADCPNPDFSITGYKTICEACIAKWLNSEFDGRW